MEGLIRGMYNLTAPLAQFRMVPISRLERGTGIKVERRISNIVFGRSIILIQNYQK
jgi:hypothetical protein